MRIPVGFPAQLLAMKILSLMVGTAHISPECDNKQLLKFSRWKQMIQWEAMLDLRKIESIRTVDLGDYCHLLMFQTKHHKKS